MIITVDLSEAGLKAAPRSEMEGLFREIARSSIRGHHRYLVSRNIIDLAISSLDLAEQERAHLRHLRSMYTQDGGLRAQSSVILSVVIGNNEVSEVRSGYWQVGHRVFLRERYADPLRVVVEDASRDGEFYSFVFAKEAQRHGFGELSYELVHGGGSSMAKELRRQIDRGYSVICICDTDLLAPLAKTSHTYRNVKEVDESCKYVGALFGTPGREVENFISLEIIAEMDVGKSCSDLDKLLKLFLRQTGAGPGDCIWLYFDIKDGAVGRRLSQSCISVEVTEWICKKYDISVDEIESFNIAGFGGNVLACFLSDGRALSMFVERMRGAYWRQHYAAWFAPIFWFACGRKPVRAF